MLDAVLLWIDKNQNRWLGELQQWLSIPSISAQPEHKADLQKAAGWAADYLRGIGLRPRIIQTPGHPCIVATTPPELCEPNAPHYLLYGHYDVQPPEPLELWQSPPFQPTVRNGSLFARGACDDKGQVQAHLAAMMAWREIGARLPVRLTLILEGEEEIGSPHLMEVVHSVREELSGAKALIISDSNQFAPGVPAITYGLRGLVYFEILLQAANTDLHSGMYGGAVINPANVLARLLGALQDADGHILIPGFYDQVRDLTHQERAMWAGLPFSEEALAQELGLKKLSGEPGFTALERKWSRPTLDINGLTAGYQGPGSKTVLPCQASAKVSMRLVPDQDPAVIAALFEKTVRSLIPPEVTLTLKNYSLSPPALTPMDSPAVQAAARALEIGYGHRPVLTREGGTIPVVNWFKEALGLETLMIGFGLPNDRIHAPNEKLDLDCYYGGIRTAAALYDELARI